MPVGIRRAMIWTTLSAGNAGLLSRHVPAGGLFALPWP
ncbi:MAG: hypothetical protein AVDCRST_MAG43-323 [uncultured Thermomicrobiales bacterium]|uniref:Uncharacterized protein n=1 Tax=uncultured Thermomicrobiales bacterium TaxID=1645740 RepID=A0A6J4UAQ3_9BACT|nr:MAG: hypothetical protein AVDCRST_MAG43-323 [uncultured Thermomicrobiales bacterium]